MIRRAVAAGSFYPAEPATLARTVDGLLARAPTGTAPTPKALVVPHAGYLYSGPVAATAYALVRGEVRSVALVGPAHFVPLHGFAVSAADVWETPLGGVAIDPDLRDVTTHGGARVDDGPHRPEHALEVQLPFLQRILDPGFAVVPVAVGVGTPAETADLLERLWGATELIVVSTDLSHYLDRAAAERVDRRTADAVVARDPDAIDAGAACGIYALRGLAELARRRELQVRGLDLRTSADTAGDPERVVGYGAFALA
ncbi:MAG: AmmeMemoRadiSam system protein B [Actinomycetota bacterium]